MQKKLLTAAVAGALAAPVVAVADVTVYGTIDTGIRSASKVCSAGGAACTADGGLLSVTEGERTTNRWGLRGSEDLGGGLRANFTLEGQYASDTGAGPGSGATVVMHSSGTTTAAINNNQGLFQRKAIVGLSGGAWSVDLGRDYTVNFKTQGIYDPMSYTYTGITPSAGNNVAGTRSSNLVTAGFRFGTGGIRLDYGFGEVPDDNGDGAYYGINGDFAFGPFTVAAAFSTKTLVTTAFGDLDQETMNIGGLWKLGSFTLRAGYSTTEYSQSVGNGDADTPMLLLGAQYAFTPTVNGRVGYYQMDFNINGVEQGSRDWLVVAVDYSLSKSTTLYAAIDRSGIEGRSITVNGQTGQITASGTAGVASTLGTNVRDGSTGLSVGIAHAF